MGKQLNNLEIRLISKVSSLYYIQDYNQQQIANKLKISRPKVSRLLKRARQNGIVQITITSPSKTFLDLETQLEKKYGLKEVVLVESDSTTSNEILKKQLGDAGSDFINRTVKNGDLIGVTWGTTLQAMIESLAPTSTENVHVIQTLGGVGPPEAKAHASDISRRLSQSLQCKLTLLPAPGIVGSKEAKKVLLSDRQVNMAIKKFERINTLFVGIGSIKTNSILTQDYPDITEDLKKEIFESDAVGDIGLRFFNENGKKSELKINDLVIGITIEEIKNIDTVVGIAGGNEKFEAIRGALRGELINILITDKQTAESLLSD